MAKRMTEREREHRRDLERIAAFRLIDDDFMTKCFEGNIECTNLLLRIILGNPHITAVSAVTQKTIKNLQGRSIRLDIKATDGERLFNIEVQRADEGANPKRARYHSSILDANTLLSGEDFDKLPETYVIFITENDVLKLGKPLYRIERTIQDSDWVLFDDEAHIIFVNGECRDDTPLGRLMHDFFCTKPDDMHYKALADRVRYFKETEEGVTTMSNILEEMRKEFEQRGEKRGILKHAMETAKRMLDKGVFTYDEIAEYASLPLKEVQKLATAKTI